MGPGKQQVDTEADDSWMRGLYAWLHEGKWRTAIAHGVLTLAALLVVGEVGADLWGLFAFGWVAAWLYRSVSDLAAHWFTYGGVSREKLEAEILDVGFPVLAVLVAAILTGGGG